MANYGREMRIGVDLRKKENRKRNRVCEKNKESIEEGRGRRWKKF